MNPSLTAALAPLLVIVALDFWVYVDAREHHTHGREVVARVGSVHIDRPQKWVTGCVVLFIVMFPLYLVARRQSHST